MPDRFTAVVEVFKVTDNESAATENTRSNRGKIPSTKEDVARVVVRSESMKLLKTRIAQHVELLEED